MPYQLEFAEDFPQIIPDPSLAHAQFSVAWKCINSGDEDSPEVGIRVDLVGADGGLLITSIGRNILPLRPGEIDSETVGIGAVGRGLGSVVITIDDAIGTTAEIPITVA